LIGPLRLLCYFDFFNFFEKYTCAPIFALLLYRKSKVLKWTKYGLGYKLGDFLGDIGPSMHKAWAEYKLGDILGDISGRHWAINAQRHLVTLHHSIPKNNRFQFCFFSIKNTTSVCAL
jgi:hypothetical protein